jgi:hypothetical protein
VTRKENFVPACSSFTKTAQSELFPSPSFFLVGETYTWALVRYPLTLSYGSPTLPGLGLDTWVTLFNNTTTFLGLNYGPPTINSAYRDPEHNHNISPKYPNSRHVIGDAIDLKNNSWGTPLSLSEYWFRYNAAYDAGAAYVEPYSAAAAGHAHADWRNTPGPYQQ